ncbi:Uncharacterised protein [Bordetella pertussis]|nr:Uncharacterised protein [Bordetella pertussis]
MKRRLQGCEAGSRCLAGEKEPGENSNLGDYGIGLYWIKIQCAIYFHVYPEWASSIPCARMAGVASARWRFRRCCTHAYPDS